MSQMSKEAPSKAYPQVVKLEKALKLAEAWVDNMSGSTKHESDEMEFEGRPSRLGLGVKFIPQMMSAPSAGPIERKLRAKLDAKKKRAAKEVEESISAERNDEQSDDIDPVSRTSAFSKKRATFPRAPLQAKRKHK